MSQRPIARSPDLKRLRDEGYNINIADGYLIVRDVPYVDASRTVQHGALLMPLRLANDKALVPDDHQAQFAGDYPCQAGGTPIEQIRHSEVSFTVGGVTARHNFSAKPIPSGRYPDFYSKVTTYLSRISGPAREIDPAATPQTYSVIRTEETESVFLYVDTASSRAEIVEASRKLELTNVAICGLGGSGGYILDAVAKTHVRNIHLFDGDTFDQHNAFRAPGAASGEDLDGKPLKVDYFAELYGRMRRGIVPHREFITEGNIAELDKMDFVFISMEAGEVKRLLVERFLARGIPFIDVGMGLYLNSKNEIGGTLRVTAGTAAKHDHLEERMPFSDGGIKNEYDKNIQIAELNMMNAALAVIRWKKLFGFYADQTGEHYSTYAVGRNDTNNEDRG